MRRCAKYEDVILPKSHGWLSREISDPARFYYWPILGRLYRRRVALCLALLEGGEKILDVGFGSGITFRSLAPRYREIHGVDLLCPAERFQEYYRREGINCHLRNGSVLELPYPENHFDAVLLISILEHLSPGDVLKACREIWRVLKPGKAVVYGVPVERRLMRLAFRLLGYNIREHHFSTEGQVAEAMREVFGRGEIENLSSPFGPVYQAGLFRKSP